MEALRKKKLPDKPKSQQEQTVDHYVAYIATQLYQIPEEHWFPFTLDNGNLIQSYIARKTNRNLSSELQSTRSLSTVQQEQYQGHSKTLQQQQHQNYLSHQQAHNVYSAGPSGYNSSACYNHNSQNPILAQSYTSNMSSGASTPVPNTSVSPSYINLQSPPYQSLSGQQLITGSDANLNVPAKETSSRADVASNENAQSDVIAFNEHLF